MQIPLSVEKCQNIPQMGVEEHMQMVRPSVFIPNDMRVVLSTAAREGLEFHPLKESFQPTFLPVTSYITATKVHQPNRANFSRRCQNRRGKCNGCVVSSSHFTLRKLSWRRRAGLKMIFPMWASKVTEWEEYWDLKDPRGSLLLEAWLSLSV